MENMENQGHNAQGQSQEGVSFLQDFRHVLGIKDKKKKQPVREERIVQEIPETREMPPPEQMQGRLSGSWIKKALFSAVFVATAAAGIVFAPRLSEAKPPSPDVVAGYNGKNITAKELQAFLMTEGAKEKAHIICEKHGYDHSLCNPEEDCEKHPVDTLEGYRAVIQIMASEQMILDWAQAKGIAQREDVQHEISDLFDNANVEEVVNRIYEQELSEDAISSLDVQLYFEQNREQYTGKNLSDVEEEIRQILLSQKEEDYFPRYIEELKKTAGLDVNYDLLKVSEPANDEIYAYYEQNQASFASEGEIKKLKDVKEDIRNILLEENQKKEYALREREILFAVHGRRYTLGDFYREFLELSESYRQALSGYDGKKQLLDQLIVKELLLEQDSDAADSASATHDMEELKIQYLMQVMHEEEVEQKLSDPTQEEIQTFYEANKSSFVTTEGTQLTLEEARETIAYHLKAEKHNELTAAMEQKILEESNLVIYDRSIRKLLKEQNN